MIRRIIKAAALVWIAKKVAGYAERRGERRTASRAPARTSQTNKA